MLIWNIIEKCYTAIILLAIVTLLTLWADHQIPMGIPIPYWFIALMLVHNAGVHDWSRIVREAEDEIDWVISYWLAIVGTTVILFQPPEVYLLVAIGLMYMMLTTSTFLADRGIVFAPRSL
jgi:hypothetical protein